MADNSLKTPFGRALNKLAQKRIDESLQMLGRALPVTVVSVFGTTNTIVTVQFNVKTDFTLPQVTIPVAFPEYIRLPLKAGDRGLTVPADVLLGGVTGLGSGNPPLLSMAPANLQGLVFIPIGNNAFTQTDDVTALVLYGPNGVIIRDTGKNCTITVGQANITVVAKTQVQVKVGNNASLTIKDGEIDISATTLKLNGKVWDTHAHTGVTTGSGTSGPVA